MEKPRMIAHEPMKRADDTFNPEKFEKLIEPGLSRRAKRRQRADVPEFRQWLADRGCKGVDNVVIFENRRPGLRVDAPVTKDKAVLVVPRRAWISVPIGELELESETELAWRLLCEHWMGEESEFSPYVDFLWGVDMSLHPLFWSHEEVMWLRSSPGAFDEVVRMRDTISVRARALAARASAPGSNAPAELLEDPKRLEAELRFALTLVEVRAVQASPASEGEPALAAMVPLLDHMQHDPREDPPIAIADEPNFEGAPMIALATRVVHAREEIRHCYEPVGNAQLLARYGCVPVAKGTSQEERLKVNAFASVDVPVRCSSEVVTRNSEACLARKFELLAEHAGIDLRKGADAEQARLELPKDIYAGGRLLPVARFLATVAKQGADQTPEAACDALFEEHFQGVAPAFAGPAPKLPFPATENIVQEVNARATAWEWCEHLLNGYQKSCLAVMDDIGIKPQEEGEEGAAAAGDAEKPVPVPSAEIEGLVDAVVLAHYKAKAKSPGRKSAKSLKPREARLLAVSDGRATVQFLSNGVRHQVPQDWVVRKPGPKMRVVDPIHAGRGRLVMALYSNEAAVVESAYNLTQNIVATGCQLLDALNRNMTKELPEITQRLKQEWESEQDQMHEWAREAEAAANAE